MFEFSSDADPQMTVRSARKLVYNASYGACEPFDVFHGFVAQRVTDMAKSCVDLTENEYTLYKPLWVKEEIGVGETALCVRTPEKVLRKRERIF